MEKRNLKVGDIVRTEHWEPYCIVSLYSCGSRLGEQNHVLVLNSRGIIRSIHIDSIVSVVEHTDIVDEMLKKLDRAILHGDVSQKLPSP